MSKIRSTQMLSELASANIYDHPKGSNGTNTLRKCLPATCSQLSAPLKCSKKVKKKTEQLQIVAKSS